MVLAPGKQSRLPLAELIQALLIETRPNPQLWKPRALLQIILLHVSSRRLTRLTTTLEPPLSRCRIPLRPTIVLQILVFSSRLVVCRLCPDSSWYTVGMLLKKPLFLLPYPRVVAQTRLPLRLGPQKPMIPVLFPAMPLTTLRTMYLPLSTARVYTYLLAWATWLLTLVRLPRISPVVCRVGASPVQTVLLKLCPARLLEARGWSILMDVGLNLPILQFTCLTGTVLI